MSEFFESYWDAITAGLGVFVVTMWSIGAAELPLWLVMLNVAFVAHIIGQCSERFLARHEKGGDK